MNSPDSAYRLIRKNLPFGFFLHRLISVAAGALGVHRFVVTARTPPLPTERSCVAMVTMGGVTADLRVAAFLLPDIHAGAGAEQVAIAVDVIYAGNGCPVLILT